MNERIKELAREAAKITDDKLECWGEFHADYGTTWNEVFTELIVKECLEACNRANDIRYFVPPTQEQVVLSCMREIETTFRS